MAKDAFGRNIEKIDIAKAISVEFLSGEIKTMAIDSYAVFEGCLHVEWTVDGEKNEAFYPLSYIQCIRVIPPSMFQQPVAGSQEAVQ